MSLRVDSEDYRWFSAAMENATEEADKLILERAMLNPDIRQFAYGCCATEETRSYFSSGLVIELRKAGGKVTLAQFYTGDRTVQ